jgi:ankyrin repeat protein
VRQGFSEVVEFLTSQAVPLPSAILFTALHYQVSMIPSLICKGAEIHVQKINGDTLLHVAMSRLTETQCRTTTQILLEAGCDPFALNVANKQPIHLAISRGFTSVVEYLLSYAFNAETSLPPDVLLTALQCHEKKFSVVRLLVDHGADVSYLAPNGPGDHVFHTVLKRLAGE